ncbi:hypothetical protein [Nocardioides yefusunii]|uniref:Uncharacterized protein n=1 Tax=Nocardioides yefusunii TaxID=2500546 RepID=A0ABW1QV36_9ACTN|nr:hypothetical protein [Nocardioides yefusunii]
MPAHVPPIGNVLWIDPSDELVFLSTLSVIGYISFMTQERRQG